MTASRRLRIAVIAPLRFPLRPPHAGGLEAAVWTEVDLLRRAGHAVSVVGVAGSDFVEAGTAFSLPPVHWTEHDQRTDQTWPMSFEATTIPALGRALDEVSARRDEFDVVANHCLHPLPLWRAPALGVPMVTTLHTPVDAEFVRAHVASRGGGSVFLSVSEHTRREWAHAGVPSALLANGVDPDAWRFGRGGDGLVWFGRIVPEKAPHLAVDVARRLGRPLTIAGRVGDQQYADDVLFPLLGGGIDYVGELAPAPLADLVAGSGLSLATPSWAEPFGLVAPEALMCGTPVVSFAVGGVPEIAARSVGMRLAPAGDTAEMSRVAAELLAATEADPFLRAMIRQSAQREFGVGARIDALTGVFAGLADSDGVARELSA